MGDGGWGYMGGEGDIGVGVDGDNVVLLFDGYCVVN